MATRETHDLLNERLERSEFMPFAPVIAAEKEAVTHRTQHAFTALRACVPVLAQANPAAQGMEKSRSRV